MLGNNSIKSTERGNLSDSSLSAVLTEAQAEILQEELASRVELCPYPETPKLVAGADLAYDKNSDRVFGAIVVQEFPSLEKVEVASLESTTSFPYIPGLLSFREVPTLLKIYEQLTNKPDVIICDGQGIAHPRRFGLASHFGVLLDIPTIGCAKNWLVGDYQSVADQRGSHSEMIDKGEVVGGVFRTQDGVNPVFVSPGHKIDLQSSLRIIGECGGRYRIPEPTRAADHVANELRRSAL